MILSFGPDRGGLGPLALALGLPSVLALVFYAAAALRSERFPAVLRSALFAGWIAHAREQLAGGRLIRPQSRYVGPAPRLVA